MDAPTSVQFLTFKDCIASRLLAHSSLRAQTDSTDSGLDEFSSYLALESWATLPESLHTASYITRASIPSDIDDICLDATPTSFVDTLSSYGFVSDQDDALVFLRKAIADYIAIMCAAPPPWSATRTKECEICEREVPLTYHHLIPRSTHAKVLKQKLHPEEMINSVAWLCRPCHSVVHSAAKNEELAKNYFTRSRGLELNEGSLWSLPKLAKKLGRYQVCYSNYTMEGRIWQQAPQLHLTKLLPKVTPRLTLKYQVPLAKLLAISVSVWDYSRLIKLGIPSDPLYS